MLLAPRSHSHEQRHQDEKQNRAQAFPEQQRIAFDQRRGPNCHELVVWVTKAENKLGQLLITLERIRTHRFLDRFIDPHGYFAVVVERRPVSQLSLLGFCPRLGDLGAVRQLAGSASDTRSRQEKKCRRAAIYLRPEARVHRRNISLEHAAPRRTPALPAECADCLLRGRRGPRVCLTTGKMQAITRLMHLARTLRNPGQRRDATRRKLGGTATGRNE